MKEDMRLEMGPPGNSSSSETLGDGCTEASGILGWRCVMHLY